MAKKPNKTTPNVAEQLKKFNQNIIDEEILDAPIERVYNFKKKDVTTISDTSISQQFYEKIPKDDLLRLAMRLQTIEGKLKQEIIDGIENDDENIREKVLQIQTPDLRLINEILINL
jgi:cobalamin-dependent methionine synthase I